MHREADYKDWLEQGGAQTANGRATRVFALRTIEQNINKLGIPYSNLEEAWKADHFVSLRERLRKMREDAKDGGQDYRMIMPDSENPHNRLANWGSWLGQYGRFLAGDPPGPTKDADRIRQYVLEHYIEPAREEGKPIVDVLVKDVHAALGLKQAWANVCQSIDGRTFQKFTDLSLPEIIGAKRSPATIFRFNLSEGLINKKALEVLRDKFLAASPDFRTFLDPGTDWARDEKAYKVQAAEKVRLALESITESEELGKTVFEILKTASKNGPLVRWQTEDTITTKTPELLADFYAITAALIRSEEPPEIALSESFAAFSEMRNQGAKSLTYGERINILFSALSMVNPKAAAPLKISKINSAWILLTGEKLFEESKSDIVKDYHRFSKIFEDIFKITRDEWGWKPQDWIDIQGFLWIAMEYSTTNQQVLSNEDDNEENQMSEPPTNLILYGPPGTGKTYETASEAVRLCGETVPEDRHELMTIYKKLMAAGRIEFITFHQSMAYEDFVEGRQPMTGSDSDQGDSSSGFRLETVSGIFRRISKRAETSRGRTSIEDAIDTKGRKILKMSIGEANNPEDAHLFEDAIAGGYTILGFEDIDWSDEKYKVREAMIEACNAKQNGSDNIGAKSGSVQMPFRFRNWVDKGDIIVVSKGNQLFRAIGEVVGDYEFHPRPEGDYGHRRAVRWLWVDRDGVPVDEIYSRRFMQQSIYLLYDKELNIPALERYMNSQQNDSFEEPTPFVLIIDEINRANISKVFGELITLLEADKRIGQTNELKVRLPYSGDDFGVPSNLHILGTMNTADRSIALLDTALRRRFTFREMMPDPAVLKDASTKCGINLPRLLKNMNERIEYLYDREHQIGHAYFTNCNSRADVDDVMRNKIIPLLAEYFFEDWSKIAAILGDFETHDNPILGNFLNRTILNPPPGLADGDENPRHRWQIRPKTDGFNYEGLADA